MTSSKMTRRKVMMTVGSAGASVPFLGSSALQAFGKAVDPKRGGMLRISVADRTASLNPFIQLNSTGYILNEMLYMGITRIDENMVPQGDAVSSWKSNDDATEFLFTMRPNIVFHNGEKATANDAVASINAVLDPQNTSPAANNLTNIESVSQQSDEQFSVSLKSRDANLPILLASINLRLIPASVLENNIDSLETSAVGSGPFKLSSHEPGRRTSLERFGDYFDGELPYLDSVEINIFPDKTAENASLMNGESDVMLISTNADFPRFEEAPQIVAHRQATGGFFNIVLRTDTSPFDDRRVREAIALCLDRDVLNEVVLQGYGRPAYDNVISPEYRYGLPLRPFEQNYEKARGLLADAGFADGFSFTCYASNSPKERETLAVVLRELLKPVGINVEVKVVSYDDYVANIWRKAGCYIALWNMEPTEDKIFTTYYTSDAPYNDSAYQNPDFDALVKTARSTKNEDERAAKYAEAQEMLIHDLPWSIPFYRDYLSAHHESVQGYTTHPLNYPHFFERVWLDPDA